MGSPFQGQDEALGRRLPRPFGKGGKNGVDDIDSASIAFRQVMEPCRRYHGYEGEYGNGQDLLEALDDIIGRIGREKTSHVFEAKDIDPEVLQLPRLLQNEVDSMDRADGVTDGSLDNFPNPLDRLDDGLEISNVVESIEGPEDIDSILCRLLHKARDDIVGIMAISHQALSPNDHLHLGIRHCLS